MKKTKLNIFGNMNVANKVIYEILNSIIDIHSNFAKFNF